MQLDRELLRGFSQYRASAVALIAANLVPLLGVLLFGWDAFEIVALYWAENVVIGAINVLKIVTCNPDPSKIDWSKLGTPDQVAEIKATMDEHGSQIQTAKLAHHGSKLFFAPFFTLHYGLFCLVHGVFVFALFGHDAFGEFGELGGFVRVFSEQHLWWGVVALAASHLYSFFVNFLGHGEYRRTFAPLLMVQPYARIFVLHIAILFGGFVAMALGSNVGVLTLLVAGKTLLDLGLHLRERQRNAKQPDSPRDVILEEAPPLAN
jgi:hypothetical protein